MSVKPNARKRRLAESKITKPTTSLFAPHFGVVENTINYISFHFSSAVIGPNAAQPVAFADYELAQKIAKLLSDEYEKENPTCAGCAAFGPPTWEGDIGDGGEGWYHFTGKIHPFKEKYIWCARMNKQLQNVSEEDLQTQVTLDDAVLDNQAGTKYDLAQFVGRHFAALHEFPDGPERKKFIEEVREIQEDIRGWKIEEPTTYDESPKTIDRGDVVYTVDKSAKADRKLMGLKHALKRNFNSDGKTVSHTAVLSSDYNLLQKIKDLLNCDSKLPVKADVKQAPPSMDETQVQFHLRCIAGRILTLVDAMVADPDQKKAFKTYVKKEFREQFRRVEGKFREWSHGGDSETSAPEELQVADAAFN